MEESAVLFGRVETLVATSTAPKGDANGAKGEDMASQ
jgi:hypothetical protein